MVGFVVERGVKRMTLLYFTSNFGLPYLVTGGPKNLTLVVRGLPFKNFGTEFSSCTPSEDPVLFVGESSIVGPKVSKSF